MRLLPLTLVCASLALPLLSAPADAPPRVAVIRLREAIASTAEGRKRIAEANAFVAKQQEALKKEQAEIDAKRERLSDANALLNAEAKQQTGRDIERMSRQFQRHLEDVQWEAQQRESRMYSEIGPKMMKVVDDYAAKNNFTLVVDISQPATPIVWAAAGADITGKIVQQYDLAHPAEAKPAAGARAPARK